MLRSTPERALAEFIAQRHGLQQKLGDWQYEQLLDDLEAAFSAVAARRTPVRGSRRVLSTSAGRWESTTRRQNARRKKLSALR